MNQLYHIVHIHASRGQISIYRVNMGMDQFDIIVKTYTRHDILVNLEKIKDDRHQYIQFLLDTNCFKLC